MEYYENKFKFFYSTRDELIVNEMNNESKQGYKRKKMECEKTKTKFIK